MRRAMAITVLVVTACPGSSWAQPAAPQEVTTPPAAPQPAEPRAAPRLSRARILTGAGLLIGGVAFLASARANESAPRDDRRLWLYTGLGATAAGGLVLALPRGADAGEEDEAADKDADDTPGRPLKWTGIGLTIGGGVWLLQSLILYEHRNCGSPFQGTCDNGARASAAVGGVLAATGLTLIVLEQQQHRHGARVALGIAPRAVRVNVSF
jgi:hypothetical protein